MIFLGTSAPISFLPPDPKPSKTSNFHAKSRRFGLFYGNIRQVKTSLVVQSVEYLKSP